MHVLRIVSVSSAFLALAACASPPPISANPVQTAANAVAATPLGGTVVQGLQDSAWNLDQAIAIGVLPKDDRADACVHATLSLITPGANIPSFTPKVSDLLSAGSVAYIVATQAKQLAASGGLKIPPECEQLVGEFVIKGIAAPTNVVISGVVGGLP